MKLLENFVTFEKKTAKALTNLVDRLYTKNLTRAREFAQQYTINYILNTNTAQELDFGSLAGHFGIPIDDQFNTVDTIAETIGEHINVTLARFPPSSKKVRTKITITLPDSVYHVLFNLPEAEVSTESGDVLPWLEWLLFFGDEPIIGDHHIEFITGKGRSGLAIMVPGDTWSIPSDQAGTPDDNWITRAVQSDDYLDGLAQNVYSILYS